MSRSTRLLISLFAVFALVLAACGDDDADDTATEGDESSETTEAEGDDAAETTEAMEDEDEGETTEAEGEGDGEGDGDAMVDAECPAESGTLNVGTKFDQPLFGVNTPDGVVGFDAEIAKYVAEQLGCTDVEFQEAVSANREPFPRERHGRHGGRHLHDQRRPR